MLVADSVLVLKVGMVWIECENDDEDAEEDKDGEEDEDDNVEHHY